MFSNNIQMEPPAIAAEKRLAEEIIIISQMHFDLS